MSKDEMKIALEIFDNEIKKSRNFKKRGF
jgi:hypothetical protein